VSWRAGELERHVNAVELKSLTKRFGESTAVDSLCFSVDEGEIFGLVGPDGAGKTTTLRLLAGILEPTSGEAQVDGVDILRSPETVKERIGYMSQRFGLYPDLTVDENIRFYADVYGVSREDRLKRGDRLLGFSGLAPFRKRFAGNLSGGMKQKLGLACALIHTPRVLLLDEPTNGVDPVSRRDFWRILYQLLKEGVTILVSTSYLDEAERCARVALLHRGRLLACDTPDGVKGLMKEQILEARSPDARALAGLMRRQDPSRSVGLFGDRVHVATWDAESARREIEEICRAGGIRAGEFRVVEPSLEDVFVSVVGREEH
jgi:ABC-2 type transport system ATP-binding protein